MKLQKDDSANRPDEQSPPIGIVARIFVETFLAGHLVVAAFALWLTPKGFPVNHSRFWLNSAIPVAAIVVAAIGLVGMLRQRYRLAGFALLVFAAAWAAMPATGRLYFPLSLRRLWIAGIFPAGAALVAYALVARRVRIPERFPILAAIVGASLGYFVIWAGMPCAPATHPLGEVTMVNPGSASDESVARLVHFGESYQFYPAAGYVEMNCGSVTIRCFPLLEFDRISPDGFWSLLAPKLTAIRRVRADRIDAGVRVFDYGDGSAVRLLEPTEAGRFELIAYSNVKRDTFSHLNSYCVFEISGHNELALSFSPCDETAIDVLPADYPHGRPARFAYLDATETFTVVEATSAEKGPFHSLASGPLLRSAPLTITFRDDGEPIAFLTLADWASQLSTTLSPTAGWGVPENAIEFRRHGSEKNATATIWITLASTAIGRGWDTVGHRAGTYRNRLGFRAETP